MNGNNGMSPEERKLALDEKKYQLDKERLLLDQSFAKTWAPVIVGATIPLLVALATAIISFNQYQIAARDSNVKAVDYYVKVLTDNSYKALPASGKVTVVNVLAKYYPDIWTTQAVYTIVYDQILSGQGASSDPNQDDRLQALSRLPPTPASAVAPTQSAGGIATSKYTIYLHYKNPGDKDVIDGISQGLRRLGYTVPPSQVVVQPTRGDIRYYKPGERPDAEQLSQNINNITKPNVINLTLLDISKTFPNLPSGLMEVWIPDLHSASK